MKKVLIVGSGIAGQNVLEEIENSPELGLEVVGFIDDNQPKDSRVGGLPILGDRQTIGSIVRDQGIKEVIIAIPSAPGEQIQDIVRICTEIGVDFRIVPRVKEIIEGKAHIQSVRKVRLEDLLGRPVVKTDVQELKDFFQGKIVLITGAAGSIGSELSRQICAYGPNKVVLLDCWESGMYDLEIEIRKCFSKLDIQCFIANIQDRPRVKSIFDQTEPDYVFHAAAFKHVPLMEENPSEAIKNNIFGTLNVIEEAVEHRVERFVVVSTDKAANPVNVMGATKLSTEILAKKANKSSQTKFMMVRFGNVLGSYGSVVPLFLKQIEQGGPVTVTDKRMTRFFMTIPEAAQLILKASLLGDGGELFVLDMGQPVKIIDLAENLIRLSGYKPYEDIDIVFSGIRKGEKLDEELFTAKEEVSTTKKEKIYIAESDHLLKVDSDELLDQAKSLSALNDAETIKIRFMKLINRLISNI